MTQRLTMNILMAKTYRLEFDGITLTFESGWMARNRASKLRAENTPYELYENEVLVDDFEGVEMEVRFDSDSPLHALEHRVMILEREVIELKRMMTE